MSDAEAEKKAEKEIEEREGRPTTGRSRRRSATESMAEAYRYGGFVGAWTRTARLTFHHVYIFGTDASRDRGPRDLRRRRFDAGAGFEGPGTAAPMIPSSTSGKSRTEPKPYGPADEQAIERPFSQHHPDRRLRSGRQPARPGGRDPRKRRRLMIGRRAPCQKRRTAPREPGSGCTRRRLRHLLDRSTWFSSVRGAARYSRTRA